MSVNKTIIITGANGFIGSALTAHFSKKGYQVRALVRDSPPQSSSTISYYPYDLSTLINEKQFQGADFMIHCAYIKHNAANKNANKINIEGAKQLLNVSRKCGLVKNIFISSMSAQPDALSNYGRQKYAIEQLFNTNKDVVVRPGLILGNGGLLKSMTAFIKKNKIVPLIDGGKQSIQTVDVKDLSIAIEKIIEKDLHGIFTVAETSPVTYKAFYKALCATIRVNALFIPLPYFIVNITLRLLESTGLAKEISTENLLGLKNLKIQNTENDLDKIGVKISGYKDTLDRLFANK
ncbi:MAG: NAD(P)-dependent oxidoreductase [Bacteroidetes bacterium]|nr:NAD(P)-dependent oxidoreductase [Bacteroidota bacterium]